MDDRLLVLEGIQNFRDFGDYPTEDGRRVVKGRLFRAGNFATPSATDAARLDALDVRVIVDLRRDFERAKEPSVWPAEGAAQVIFDVGQSEAEAAPPFIAFLNRPGLTAADTREFATQAFRKIPFDPRYPRLFSAFFKAAIATDGAVLIQSALGVPEEIIIADFELTNAAIDLANRLVESRESFSRRYGVNVSLEALTPMLGVEAGFLHAAFAEMRERCGGIDGYLDFIGVEPGMREQLRERYVG
jgi:protein tyrosine/serine phosphatase